ncbi:MAG: excinuclease ABC subunit UvrC [Paracoccaceae bacterium]
MATDRDRNPSGTGSEEHAGAAEAARTGHEVIRRHVRTLDNSPGVYRMLDARGGVLYVGKARNLRKRVASYAKPAGHSARIARMISATASMMFLTTRTETEALLLEQNLIKQLKPRYNVLLRDDKSFPNILLTSGHDFPQVKKHRGSRKEKGEYFGPFASAGAVNRTLNQLQKAFLLRNCSDSVFESRTRPCLLYQIRRCSAPCVGGIGKAGYAGLVSDARNFLAGRSTRVQAQLAERMAEASAALEFERAAALRDRIRALSQVQGGQAVNPRGIREADVIALHLDGGQACVQVFFIRANQNWGNRAYFPRTGSGAGPAEILEAFIVQFYGNKTPPRLVLLSHDVEDRGLLEQALTVRAGRKAGVAVPQRGEKALLVEQAARNAREELARRMAETASQARLLDGMAKAFGLDARPARIEIYDNSHIQGAHAIGAMIVAGPEGFQKSAYRKFNIKSDDLAPGDDFAMMREVLDRRFRRLMKEDPDRLGGNWPDIVLVDGGAGQISAAARALSELGIEDVALVGVAKGVDRDAGKELFYRPGKPPFALAHRDPLLYFVQRLRDEAHRFAIGTHRARRARAIGDSPLDQVPGIGRARKRALLAHFGSAKAVGRAALEDLKSVDGISDAIAETLYGFFHAEG